MTTLMYKINTRKPLYSEHQRDRPKSVRYTEILH